MTTTLVFMDLFVWESTLYLESITNKKVSFKIYLKTKKKKRIKKERLRTFEIFEVRKHTFIVENIKKLFLKTVS